MLSSYFRSMLLLLFLLLNYGLCSDELFEECPLNVTVKLGESMSMSCVYKEETDLCSKRPYNWKKNTLTTILIGSFHFVPIQGYNQLGMQKTEVTLEDDAVYQCCLDPKQPSCCCQKNHVTVSMPLTKMTLNRFNTPIEQDLVTITENEDMDIDCIVKKARPKPTIQWKHQSSVITSSDPENSRTFRNNVKLFKNEAHLKLRRVLYENHGDIYVCEAFYSAYEDGDHGRKQVTLNVIYSPKFNKSKSYYKTAADERLNVVIPFTSNPAITDDDISITSIQPKAPHGSWNIKPHLQKEGLNQEVVLEISENDENVINWFEKKNNKVNITLSIKNITKSILIQGNYTLFDGILPTETTLALTDEKPFPWIAILAICLVITAMVAIPVIVYWKKKKNEGLKPSAMKPESGDKRSFVGSKPSNQKRPDKPKTGFNLSNNKTNATEQEDEPTYANVTMTNETENEERSAVKKPEDGQQEEEEVIYATMDFSQDPKINPKPKEEEEDPTYATVVAVIDQ